MEVQQSAIFAEVKEDFEKTSLFSKNWSIERRFLNGNTTPYIALAAILVKGSLQKNGYFMTIKPWRGFRFNHDYIVKLNAQASYSIAGFF